MSKSKAELQNRIWFELEIAPGDEINERRAALATNVLRKLGDPISKFWWHKMDRTYCVTIDSGGSYLTLSDSGHWWNLDYLGELAEAEAVSA